MPTSLIEEKSMLPLTSPAIYAGGGSTPRCLQFLPFSFGSRNCIGWHLAMLEIKTSIAHLLKQFHFELVDPRMLDEDFAMDLQFTLRPRNKLLVNVSLIQDKVYDTDSSPSLPLLQEQSPQP